jgi:hypothetical protein
MVHIYWSDPRESLRFDTLNAAFGFVRGRVSTALTGNWQSCGEGIVEPALAPGCGSGLR